MSRSLRIAIPLGVGVGVLLIWQWAVGFFAVSPIVLPAPGAIWIAFLQNFNMLMAATWTTLSITVEAFVLAVIGGVALAVLFSECFRL